MSKIIEGYKIFNSDWTCRDKQYSCPGYFEEDVVPEVCIKGMHFFTDIEFCFRLFPLKKDMHIAKIIAVGDIDEGLFTNCCTNKIFIVEEIPLKTIMGKLNPGGGTNIGYANIGEGNRGNNNIGDNNRGNNNTGINNCGNYNDGNGNNGYRNTGNFNLGNYNTGDYNIGDSNTGDHNIGYGNSGYCNIGDCNTGGYNKASYSTGYFNTKEQPIYMFNEPTELSSFKIHELEGMDLVYQLMTCYNIVGFYYNKNATCSPYCRKLRNKVWHCTFTEKQKEAVLSLPNFDAEIFKEITGIDINMEVQDIWNLI